MKKRHIAQSLPKLACVAVAGALLCHGGASADTVIQIALSVKRIASPFSGTGPEHFTSPSIDQLNNLMEEYGRGYRFVLVETGELIGEVDGWRRPSPSAYYFPNFAAESTELLNLEHDALANPIEYAWNFDAVNIYVNAGTSNHVCVQANNVEAVVLGDRDSHLVRKADFACLEFHRREYLVFLKVACSQGFHPEHQGLLSLF